MHKCAKKWFFAFKILLLAYCFLFPSLCPAHEFVAFWDTTDHELEISYLEKEYETIEKLYNLIREQEEQTQYLRQEHKSIEAESDKFYRRNPFPSRGDRYYWHERLLDAIREIKKSKEREKKLKADYRKWHRIKKSAKRSTKRSGSVGIKYTPPFSTLSISFDTERGIVLSCEGKIPTPIGTFEIYKNVAFPDKKTLTIVLGSEKHIYDLGDRSFKVNLPNDLEGKSKVEYDGKGNIVVIVPKPVFQN